MKNIAIFASGSGTNAENIINYFKNNKKINISLIVTNNNGAFVISRAKKFNIPYFVFSKSDFASDKVIKKLHEFNINFIVLAGFLLLIPENIINNFKNRIINIHPALLPKYGGKGMYGMNVHNSVIKNNEKESGITIHYVNKSYDEGDIIFQAKCQISPKDSPEDLAIKVHELEYLHFPKIIEQIIKKVSL
ncbi:MAG: phosphoribosylglycinamide formyltransferase [Bacteroidetes bacterium]|nr:MAG: phosphoribosylglycinamide formyltransferase [Bacteroidota bacterium]